MFKKIPKIFLPVIFGVLFHSQAMCAQLWQPGFRTLGVWENDPPARLDLNIWYPALRQAQELHYGVWSLRGSLNARPAQGSFPLIVLSHASAATRFSYASLCAWLASRGFIVVAPTHNTDCLDNMDDFFTWKQLVNRAREIRQSIDVALAQTDLAPAIDAARIGVAGVGNGATAALLLGGALPHCSHWAAWCNKTPASEPYCNDSARDKINLMCQNFPLAKSLADPRIKAIAAIAPGYGMLFDAESFKYFYPPLLLVTTGRDFFNKPELHSEYIARLLGQRALYLDLANADAASLLDACPDSLARELPDLCNSVSPDERKSIHNRLANSLFSFFNHYLLQQIPKIADPPDLTPPAKQEDLKPEKPQTGKKRK